MNLSTESTPSVIDALKSRGFHYVSTSQAGWLHLKGSLNAGDAAHPCEIEIDPNFFDLPCIRLLDVPAQLRPIAPHINDKGEICYFAKAVIVLDIFDPVGQTIACLERAEHVLGRLLRGEMVEDLEEEFFAYWDGWPCVSDLEGQADGKRQAVLGAVGDLDFPVVSDNLERTRKKIEVLGWRQSDMPLATYQISTIAKPRPSQSVWPLSNLRELLWWQAQFDSTSRQKIETHVKDAANNGSFGTVLLIESPALVYGVLVLFNKPAGGWAANGKPNKIPNLFESRVKALSVTRVDDRYIAERNVPNRKTLAGKRIAIVGIGTIGGYLADMLVKAGAGTGGGQLTLVDMDTLGTNNIGRHRLGFSSLFLNKAKALCKELLRDAPGADIRALPVRVQSANLSGIDLLINATGEEALGHWVAANHESSIPLLSVWIEGPGVAVRGLFQDNVGGACCRCLTSHVRNGRYRATEGDIPLVTSGQGCEELYVPFPATVSVQAACLGTEMTIDWANDLSNPKLRTRITDSKYSLGSKDCNPEKVEGCPACSK